MRDILSSEKEGIPSREQDNRRKQKIKKYQVIGGQYESAWYGESDSLHGAKLIAAKRDEYWDNWQGWHRPSIYLAGDVKEIESKGRITTPDGVMIRVPIAEPTYKYDYKSNKWCEVTR